MLQSNFGLEEFSSDFDGDTTLFFHIVRMQSSAYVWVGTEAGNQGCLVGGSLPRIPVPGGSVSTVLLEGNSQDTALQSVQRLIKVLKFPIMLSLDIPDSQEMLLHVESTIIEKFKSKPLVCN